MNTAAKVFGALRDVHQRTEESVALGSDRTVAGLLQLLRERNPNLVAKLEEGLADGYLSALVNGRNIRFLQNLQSTLSDGDTVAFLPPVGGG